MRYRSRERARKDIVGHAGKSGGRSRSIAWRGSQSLPDPSLAAVRIQRHLSQRLHVRCCLEAKGEKFSAAEAAGSLALRIQLQLPTNSHSSTERRGDAHGSQGALLRASVSISTSVPTVSTASHKLALQVRLPWPCAFLETWELPASRPAKRASERQRKARRNTL